MFAYISGFVSWLAGRFRSRAGLELEVIRSATSWQPCVASVPAVRGSLRSIACSGSGFTGSGRVNIMVLVKPATVVQWHRQVFGSIGVGAQGLGGRQ
jgi:hypothetical protein